MRLLPRILGATLVLHAFVGVYNGVSTELVETRRRRRYVFLATSGSCILAVLIGEALLMREGGAVPSWAELTIAILILALAAFYSYAFGE